MNLWQRFRKSTVTNQATVVLTSVICLMTLVNIGFFIKQVLDQDRQVREIRSAITDGISRAKTAMDNVLSQQNTSFQKLLGENRAALDAAAEQSKAALDAAIENFRLDQRAWVGTASVTVPPEIKEGSGLAFTIVITNSGKTPALKFASRGRYELLRANESFTPRDIMNSRPAATERGIVQPGERRTITVRITGPITKAQVDAVKSKTAIFYVFGEITYEDIFKRPHFTEFCLILDPITPPGFTPCDTYNDGN